MQICDDNSNLVVRIPAKRATAISQQESVNTEQRESRRAIEAHRLYSGIISDPSYHGRWKMYIHISTDQRT